MRQGDEGGGGAHRPRDRLAAAADRQARARAARQHAAGRDRDGAAQARRLDHGADRPRRLSAQRSDLGDAGGAQEVRAVRRRAAVALVPERRLDPQGRRHRVRARAHRRHALFGDRGGGRAGVPSERRHHGGDAGDHPQGREPGRPRGVRDRPHAPAPEGDGRAQGAGLPARLRHVRRGVPQGRQGVSRRRVRGGDDRHHLDEAGDGAAAVRRGGHHQPVRRHPERHRRGAGRRARARARPVRRRAAGDGAGDARLGAGHRRAATSPIPTR